MGRLGGVRKLGVVRRLGEVGRLGGVRRLRGVRKLGEVGRYIGIGRLREVGEVVKGEVAWSAEVGSA